MKSKKQRTIGGAREFSDVALFSGQKVNVRLLPAAPPTRASCSSARTSTAGRTIPASTDFVALDDAAHAVLKRGIAEVGTVEHILAAAAGARVDNMIIEIDGDEVPNIDGSALGFYEADEGARASSSRTRRVRRSSSTIR